MRSIAYGLIAGGIIGVLLATPPTFLDWQANPGGIFHGPAGTDWAIVSETFLSWLWPTALVATPFTVAFCAWKYRSQD